MAMLLFWQGQKDPSPLRGLPKPAPAVHSLGRGFESFLSTKNKKHRRMAMLFFWQGQKDSSPLRGLPEPAPAVHSLGRGFESSPSLGNKKTTPIGVVFFWQGQKDSNPRHAGLETAALPAELYPCVTRTNLVYTTFLVL